MFFRCKNVACVMLVGTERRQAKMQTWTTYSGTGNGRKKKMLSTDSARKTDSDQKHVEE